GADVLDAKTGTRVAQLPRHSTNARPKFDLSSDGLLAVTASADGIAYISEVATGKLVTRVAHGAHVSAVAFSPDHRSVATAGVDGVARLWSLQGRLLQVLRTRPNWARTVAFSHDGRRVAVGGDGGD